MEIIRAYRTASWPAVFRLDAHLERFCARRPMDAGRLAEQILSAVEASGIENAYILVHDDGSVAVSAVPPAQKAPRALFQARGGRWFCVQGEPSVYRDTMIALTGAGMSPAPFESDEAFEIDAVEGFHVLRDGPLTRQAKEAFRRAVRGELRGYEPWVTYAGRMYV